MVDFMMVTRETAKKDTVIIKPKFIIKNSKDLMIKGGDFYAMYNEKTSMWVTSEYEAIQIMDDIIRKYVREYKEKYGEGENIIVKYLWDSSSGSIDNWHKYCQKQMSDNWKQLDTSLTFTNTLITRDKYISRVLPYALEKGDYSAWDKLISVLYDPEERLKIEWAIGAIVNGDSKKVQKFIVLYGSAGTGKSTILNIIQKLFDGYHATFSAKALGSASNSFALESLKSNPLVAIQHDGNLSKIEDNTRLNSLISHESMEVNVKHKSIYTSSFNTFLFIGSNEPVKITNAKSGIIRRLIDVNPSGRLVPEDEYEELMSRIDYELGAIAYHCKEVYEQNKKHFNSYIPINMLGATNDFFNFIEDMCLLIDDEDGFTLKSIWSEYRRYCEDSNVLKPMSKMEFKDELKNYFYEFHERYTLDGVRVRNYYKGFKRYMFFKDDNKEHIKQEPKQKETWLRFEDNIPSNYDEMYQDCPAQYAKENGNGPLTYWDECTTVLRDIDTHKLHFSRPGIQHVVIDFDIKNEKGEKDLSLNIEAASKWPPTYAELSKSGQGIHLHYLYKGDTSKLSHIFDDKVEIKTFNGKSSLRRKLTKCNDLPIAEISSGLPLKEDPKVLNSTIIEDEKHLTMLIKKALRKEVHGYTKPNIDFIYKILDDAYNSGMKYDVTSLRASVIPFAMKSNNNSDYCLNLVDKMHFKSEDEEFKDIPNDDIDGVYTFFDIEVFPNLFLICYQLDGDDQPIVAMVNPQPHEVQKLLTSRYKLIGFNCRDYDNHLVYAASMGYSLKELYKLSKRIIKGDKDAKFISAYNISYTDIYDFTMYDNHCSLKRLQIKMKIGHKELGLDWDEPVPKELWPKVIDYCKHDVYSTRKAFYYVQEDWIARQMLADISGKTVNTKTNNHTQQLIFGDDKNPQTQFNYRDMGQVSNEDIIPNGFDDYTRFNGKREFGPKLSKYIPDDMLPYGQPVFPGYEYSYGKSTYRGEIVGEGGYVHTNPGIWYNVALLDIESQHPSSLIMENHFGDEYTARFAELKQGRIYIKHEQIDECKQILDGKLSKYLDLSDPETLDKLSKVLKIPINAVYGLTSAKFETGNRCKDPRNVDNIVAKRGALFMINLKHEVAKRGFVVAHIKTDSIKIPDATPEIIQFVMDYGKLYGYNFEHEATYEKMCLVNKAVYIAKYSSAEKCERLYGYAPKKNIKKGNMWDATGTQFQIPYVFKRLFSKEEIVFDDYCDIKNVKKGNMYLDLNAFLPDVSAEERELKRMQKLLNDQNFKKFSREEIENRIEELTSKISSGHVYEFIGRVGQFTAIKQECGGGQLMCLNNGKYNSVSGTKGYRWLESYMVEDDWKNKIDYSYYEHLANDAIDAINKYGDYYEFASDAPAPEPVYDSNGRPIYLNDNSPCF